MQALTVRSTNADASIKPTSQRAYRNIVHCSTPIWNSWHLPILLLSGPKRWCALCIPVVGLSSGLLPVCTCPVGQQEYPLRKSRTTRTRHTETVSINCSVMKCQRGHLSSAREVLCWLTHFSNHVLCLCWVAIISSAVVQPEYPRFDHWGQPTATTSIGTHRNIFSWYSSSSGMGTSCTTMKQKI